jgi:hypothetical protein
LPDIRREEDRIEVDHHHATIGGKQAQHVVRDVARMRIEREGVRMREDDRGAGHLKRVLHRRRGDMAEVDQHAEPVHLGDVGGACGADAVVLRLVRCAVRPVGGLVVGQRHVTDAKIVEAAQRGHRAADLAATLHAEHRADPSGAMDPDHVVGGEGELEVARVGLDQPPRRVDLLDGRADRLIAGQRAADVDRPELAADAPGAKPGHVGHHRLGPACAAAREAFHPALVILAQLPGQIVVAVDEWRPLEDAVDPCLGADIDRLGGRCGRGEAKSDREGTEYEHAFALKLAGSRVQSALPPGAFASMKRR